MVFCKCFCIFIYLFFPSHLPFPIFFFFFFFLLRRSGHFGFFSFPEIQMTWCTSTSAFLKEDYHIFMSIYHAFSILQMKSITPNAINTKLALKKKKKQPLEVFTSENFKLMSWFVSNCFFSFIDFFLFRNSLHFFHFLFSFFFSFHFLLE